MQAAKFRRNSAGCEFSHPAKFHRLRNFATCKNSQGCEIFYGPAKIKIEKKIKKKCRKIKNRLKTKINLKLKRKFK